MSRQAITPPTATRPYRFACFIRRTLITVAVLSIFCAFFLLVAFTFVFLDCQAELHAWYDFLHSDTYLVGDAEIEDFREFRTTPDARGAYDVYYSGTIYPDVCDRLINLCLQSGLDQVVLQRLTLPNGVRKWYTISLDTLYSIRDSSSYELPILCTNAVRINTSPEAWLEATCLRPCQDWMSRDGCTVFGSYLYCVFSAVVICLLLFFGLGLIDYPFCLYVRRVLAAQRADEPTLIIDVRGATFTLVDPAPPEPDPGPAPSSDPNTHPKPPAE